MSKLYNFTLYFKGIKTYTAKNYGEALDKLSKEYGDVDVVSCGTEEFDENEDDNME